MRSSVRRGKACFPLIWFFLVACAGFSHQLIGQSVENLGSKGIYLLFNVVFRRVPFLGRAPGLAK